MVRYDPHCRGSSFPLKTGTSKTIFPVFRNLPFCHNLVAQISQPFQSKFICSCKHLRHHSRWSCSLTLLGLLRCFLNLCSRYPTARPLELLTKDIIIPGILLV